MLRSSTQVVITHRTPNVTAATALALTATVAGLPFVAVAGPIYIRESAVLELYAQGETAVLESVNELLELFCQESLATTTVTAFTQEEANK